MHEGQKLREIIRNNGYLITTLAHQLGISRTAVYNRLKKKKLSPGFFKEVKEAMGTGLVQMFPPKTKNEKVGKADLIRGQWYYMGLLGKHCKLKRLVIKVMVNTKQKAVRQEISTFIEELYKKKS